MALVGNRWFTVELGPQGVLQLQDASGVRSSSAPEDRRYQDHGEFWDAWDLLRITASIRWRCSHWSPLSCRSGAAVDPLLLAFSVGTSAGEWICASLPIAAGWSCV